MCSGNLFAHLSLNRPSNYSFVKNQPRNNIFQKSNLCVMDRWTDGRTDGRSHPLMCSNSSNSKNECLNDILALANKSYYVLCAAPVFMQQWEFYSLLDAFSHLYKRVHLSVRRSVRRFVIYKSNIWEMGFLDQNWTK